MIPLPDFDPISSDEDWADTIELTDADTGDAADLTGFALSLEARLLTPNGVDCAAVSGGTTSGELTYPSGASAGVVDILFRVPFNGKVSGVYRITIKATNGTDTIVFVSNLPVQNLSQAPA